ncbi:fructosamine kinase family protein [Nocardia caishijiensis]|uniref:Fructosamine-3-kinase n=1 Tax=Nocardia caishijiensis TaxID=184756 RepID=A0ABQ6YSP7_9NOCA|nr:fructosamine kinase family protein [Nocardia caishijiensis]KAF0848431.1 fructosamine-3-kinase [Nocardia caishijiensis]
MDLPYLRANPHLLPTFLAHQRLRTTPVGGGSIAVAERIGLDDGTQLFLKTWPGGISAAPTGGAPTAAPQGFFATEARGLRWLREADGVPIPEVYAVSDDLLLMEWVDHAEPSPAAAERFGAGLARLHDAGAPEFGTPGPGFLGNLPMDNTPGQDWASWFHERRIIPLLKLAVDAGGLDPADATAVASIRVEAPAEPPSRIHGDLWPGNILWSQSETPWLIDPAAHGGHRETDLATLHLFGGAPHLARIVGAYNEVHPLEPGWRERVPLHQLPLLLAHAALFGRSYRTAVLDAAARYR